MSEVIVQMEMPLNCWECKFRKPMGICPITVRYVLDDAGRNHRPDWCPIVGVLPETHGDLIDRDKLLKDIEMYHVSDGCFQHWCQVQKAVVTATERSET